MIKHLRLKAYGKINLALDVLGKRDNGYHDVRMIMQTVGLHDRIELYRTKEPGIRLETNLFYLPNNYIYSGFPVHTLDMFFLCQVEDTSHFEAMDDVADSFFVPLCQINPEEFGLGSIKKGLKRFLKER